MGLIADGRLQGPQRTLECVRPTLELVNLLLELFDVRDRLSI